MKKLIFSFIATVMIAAVSFGQTFSQSGKTATVNAQMVSLVAVSKTFYTRGQSYDDFVKSMLIPTPTVPSQDELLRKVYFYTSNGTADCDILKGDNSSLSKFASDLSKNPANQTTYDKNPKKGKKWWQILINVIVNVVADVVTDVDVPPIDLFPNA